MLNKTVARPRAGVSPSLELWSDLPRCVGCQCWEAGMARNPRQFLAAKDNLWLPVRKKLKSSVLQTCGPKYCQRRWIILSQASDETAAPADTLMVASWDPVQSLPRTSTQTHWENKCVLFETTKFVVTCYAAIANYRIQPLYPTVTIQALSLFPYPPQITHHNSDKTKSQWLYYFDFIYKYSWAIFSNQNFSCTHSFFLWN